MKILRELLIIFSICLVGQFISELLPIPFPASVLSLVILLLLLVSKIFKPHWIQNLSGLDVYKRQLKACQHIHHFHAVFCGNTVDKAGGHDGFYRQRILR